MTRLLRRGALALATAAAALASPGSAAAQFPLQPVDEPRQTPGWTMTPSLAVSAGWDDNVSMAGTLEEGTTDAVTVITPSIEAAYLGRYNWIGFGYAGSFSRYHDISDLNSYSQRLRVDTRHRLSKRLSASLRESFAASPTTDAVMVRGVPFLRTGSRVNELGGDLEFLLDKFTSLSAGYAMTWVEFSKDSPFTERLQGGTSHSWTGTVARRVATRLSVGAEGAYHRSLLSRMGQAVSMVDTWGTVNYEASRTLSLSGAFGLSHVGETSAFRARTAPAWRLGATQRFERAALTASWSRSFVPAFGLGGSVQNEQVDASLHMPVARNRLYWQAGMSWHRTEHLLATGVNLRSLWLHTSVGYHLHRLVRAEAFYGRTQQNSLRAGGQVNRNQFGIRLVTSRPMRIR
ncbi:MAG TPA: hypothetical protein VK911_12045 [Vicinamibacterales bacterium]|nr:hypothetical protein [Vicinamibacterales bacterium]